MTVRLKKILSEKYYDLSANKDYQVIEIEFIKNSNESNYIIYYRILNDFGTPGIYSNLSFQMIDEVIESDYIYMQNEKTDNICIIPKVMSYQNFWEDYFNDEIKAKTIFEQRFLINRNEIQI